MPRTCPKCESSDVHARQKLGDWTCLDCGHCRRPESVGASPGPPAMKRQGLEFPELARLPYPVALTAKRLPVNLSDILTHPSGRTWAGGAGSYLCLITLEGATELLPEGPSRL